MLSFMRQFQNGYTILYWSTVSAIPAGCLGFVYTNKHIDILLSMGISLFIFPIMAAFQLDILKKEYHL